MSTTKFTETRDKLDAMRLAYRELARAEFGECSKVFFAQFPTLDAIRWQQYTPYFNDGDECVFGVNNDAWGITLIIDNEEVEFSYSQRNTDNPENIMRNSAAEFLQTFDNDTFKELFGDHVTVTLNSDGTNETKEFSHD